MEFHGASMELHVIPWSFHGTPWGFNRIPWNSMKLYGILWNSMEFNTMEFLGVILHGRCE